MIRFFYPNESAQFFSRLPTTCRCTHGTNSCSKNPACTSNQLNRTVHQEFLLPTMWCRILSPKSHHISRWTLPETCPVSPVARSTSRRSPEVAERHRVVRASYTSVSGAQVAQLGSGFSAPPAEKLPVEKKRKRALQKRTKRALKCRKIQKVMFRVVHRFSAGVGHNYRIL